MQIEKFEEIIAWQKGKELTVTVYKALKVCKDFGFKNQIERASVSIMNNIAEGFERRTNKELKNFLSLSNPVRLLRSGRAFLPNPKEG